MRVRAIDPRLLLAVLALAGCSNISPGAVTRGGVVESVSLQPAAAQVQPHYEAARAALVEGNRAKALREVKLALQDNPLDAPSHFRRVSV